MSKNTNTQIQTDPKHRFFNPPPTSLPKPGPKRKPCDCGGANDNYNIIII